MKLNRKNLYFLIILIFTTSLLVGWFVLLLWWSWYTIIWTPIVFAPIAIIVGFLLLFPSIYFIKAIIKIKRNPEERIKFSKKSLFAGLFIFFIISSFTIVVIMFATIPSMAFLYNHDEGPYLIWNDDPKTSMTIIWLTEKPSQSELKYGKSTDDMKTVSNNFQVKRHVVKLEDLNPGTLYYYKIPGFSKETYYFKTAPKETTPFNFTVIGDNRNNGGINSSHYDDIIEAMEAYRYNFIINVGDVYNDGLDYYSMHEFLNNMAKHASTRPYMISIGNHEYVRDYLARNFKYFFPYDYACSWGHYYSFDYSNAHFVMIDCFENPLSGGHYVSEVQYQWIKKELSENQDKWLFVALHVPPYSTGDFNMDYMLQAQLCPLFYKYKVDIVLTGHDHHYEAFWVNRTEDWGGTYYFVSGGGGADLDNYIMDREDNPWKERWHNASIEPYQKDYVTLHDQIYGELAFHFMHFEVDGKNLHIKVIRANGTLIQEFDIKK
ncbi:MAG: metallophosphoesterase [Promethearchaeota archaeon]